MAYYVRLTCFVMCVFVDTEEQKKRFREDPQHGLKYRKMMESELNQRFKFIVQGTPEQKASLEVRGTPLFLVCMAYANLSVL